MGRMSLDTRSRVIYLHQKGWKLKDIQSHLKSEDLKVSKTSLSLLIAKYRRHHTVADLPRPPKQKKLSLEHLQAVDEALANDDEISTAELCSMLEDDYGVKVSAGTIQRAKKALGWVSSLPHYCQMIRDVNKQKRYLWCQQQLTNAEDFSDVIWTDECSVLIERKRKSCRRVGHPRKLKPKPKHPLKVHIWGGISMKGATKLVMFKETLTATRFSKVLKKGLIPFVRAKFPSHHKFQQDNDPKHSSNFIKKFLEDNGIEWWKTPAESPDLNPIEKVWGSMKNYLRNEHFRKLENRNFDGLKKGIKEFWKTLTPKVCRKYIRHIKKVIPIVIKNKGDATGH